jgi:hypothetical protein
MKRIFISGPITGTKNYRKNFDKAEKLLWKKGLFPVNITHLGLEAYDHLTDGHDICMEITKNILKDCNAICMLDGWEKSSGATEEYNLAVEQQKEIKTLKEWLNGS